MADTPVYPAHIDPSTPPLTRAILSAQFQQAGLASGQTILLHSSLNALGYVIGGAVAVVEALLNVLGTAGTLMVPAQSTDNSDPSYWQHPPVPPDWWSLIRSHTPAYDPQHTPLRQMGRIAETVWRWQGAQRSDHPQLSFAALGAKTAQLVGSSTPLHDGLGDASPLGSLYALDGWIFMLGTGYDTCTALHLAEARTTWEGRITTVQGAAINVAGVRQWVTFTELDWTSDDFPLLGAAFEAAQPEQVRLGTVGKATTRLIRIQPLVDFGVGWLARERSKGTGDSPTHD